MRAPAFSEGRAGGSRRPGPRAPGRSARCIRRVAAQPAPRGSGLASSPGSEPCHRALLAVPVRGSPAQGGGRPGLREPCFGGPRPHPSSPLGRRVGGGQGPRVQLGPPPPLPRLAEARGPRAPPPGGGQHAPAPASNHPGRGAAGVSGPPSPAQTPSQRGAHPSPTRSGVWWAGTGWAASGTSRPPGRDPRTEMTAGLYSSHPSLGEWVRGAGAAGAAPFPSAREWPPPVLNAEIGPLRAPVPPLSRSGPHCRAPGLPTLVSPCGCPHLVPPPPPIPRRPPPPSH